MLKFRGHCSKIKNKITERKLEAEVFELPIIRDFCVNSILKGLNIVYFYISRNPYSFLNFKRAL